MRFVRVRTNRRSGGWVHARVTGRAGWGGRTRVGPGRWTGRLDRACDRVGGSGGWTGRVDRAGGPGRWTGWVDRAGDRADGPGRLST